MKLNSCKGKCTQLAVKKWHSWAEREEESRGEEGRGAEGRGGTGKGRERKGKGKGRDRGKINF